MKHIQSEAGHPAEHNQMGTDAVRIGIIGLGNIGLPMAQGLLQSGLVTPDNLILSNRDRQTTIEKAQSLGMNQDLLFAENNESLLRSSDIVIIALKQTPMIKELRRWKENRLVKKDQIIISFAAGIRIDTIKKEIGNMEQPVARVIPNIGVKFGRGTIGWTASDEITIGQQRQIHQFLSATSRGVIYVASEDTINTVTLHYGGGPAYYCEMAEGKIEDAIQKGISKENAELNEAENIIVTAQLLEAGLSFEKIKEAICSAKGTTLAALGSLTRDNFRATISRAMEVGEQRADEIGDEYDQIGQL